MGKSFVYNTGSAEDDKKDDELWFEFGVFIDGTLNNKENTSLRRKYRKENEYSILTKAKKEADKGREYIDYITLETGGIVNPPVEFNAQEYHDYLRGIYRDTFDKAGTDNSYSNDDTNVTRMWNCCNEEYKIYIEGMGTTDKAKDSQDGFAFGSGQTGIRRRVRLACERITERIQAVKDIQKNQDKKVTQITLDVFGFSRGAASARNFVYEVNAKSSYEPHEIEIPDGYSNSIRIHTTSGEETSVSSPKTRKALGDADGLEIDPELLIDGEMPRLGHLGYSLRKEGLVTKEELEDIQIIVRFVGIYDTVSSYYEIGPLGAYDTFGNLGDDGKFSKLAKEAWSTHFTNDEEELNLHNLGDVNRFQKMVHFTAQDEHRKNFALTRIKEIPGKAIEKNLPGVHCDIGGAYENEEEECIDEIGTNTADQTHTSVKSYLASFVVSSDLKVLRKDLIDQHWYREEEIDIWREEESHKWVGFDRIKIPYYLKLTGVRQNIKKEYSYIPLHFMEEFCRETTMKEKFIRKTEKDYPLDSDPFLQKVKIALHEYVFGDAPEWEFVSDAQLELEELDRKKIEQEQKIEQEIEKNEGLEPEIVLPGIKLIEEPAIEIELPEIKITNLNTQKALRKLRHHYLHWSSNRDWFGMEPNNDRKRMCYPKHKSINK